VTEPLGEWADPGLVREFRDSWRTEVNPDPTAEALDAARKLAGALIATRDWQVLAPKSSHALLRLTQALEAL
jgi:hypothetical protein